MLRGDKTYTLLPTDSDRIVVVWRVNKGIVTSFAVQYDTRMDKVWVEVSRVDTCHGSAHRHLFNPSGKETRIAFHCNNYSQGFTEAKKFITENFECLRDNYLTQAAKRRL